MTWSYRAIKKQYLDEEYYEIHEVYYNQDGDIWGMTENPIAPIGQTLDELINELQMIITDIKQRTPLDYEVLQDNFAEPDFEIPEEQI